MEVVIGILAVIAGVVGILGSILPALPGPPLSWVGMLLLYFWGGTNGQGEEMSLTILLSMLGVTILVSVLDYQKSSSQKSKVPKPWNPHWAPFSAFWSGQGSNSLPAAS